MLVVDAQVHVWGADTDERPWLAEGAHYAHGPEYLPEELVRDMDTTGVDGAVLVPPGVWEGYRNDLVREAAGDRPARFAAMVNIDPTIPDAPATLGALLDDPVVIGLRLAFGAGKRREALISGELEWLWNELADRATPTAVFVPRLYDEIGEIASRHPQLPMALCHLGLDYRAVNPDVDGAVERLCGLASIPNMSVKASGLALQSLEPFPFRDLDGVVEQVIASFGPERVFWGSDHTRYEHLSPTGATYDHALRFFTEHVSFPSESAKELVMGRAVAQWLGWEEVETE